MWLGWVTAALLLAASLAEKERVKHSHVDHLSPHETEDGEHDPAYDQEAILGGKKAREDLAGLSQDERQAKLGEIVTAMDKNKDGYVDKEELTAYIHNNFLALNVDEAESSRLQHDKDGDGGVSWAEYLKVTYGFTPGETEDWNEDLNAEMREIADLVAQDKEKFELADRDKDGKLTAQEYACLIHPYDYEHMQDVELKYHLRDYDADKDGKISFEEYIGKERWDKYNSNPSDWTAERSQFADYDKDGDGFLNREEARPWALPDQLSSAQEEADHLMEETDSDKDGKLSREEVLAQMELWVGSSVADHLGETPSEHDEL